MGPESFQPTGIWRNGHVQSTLASLKLRRGLVERRADRLIASSTEQIIDCGDGVRLLCLHTPQPEPDAPVAILIHGWEGSANSLYLLAAATKLYEAGFEVWRLQFRDHGNSHHLNRELFHSCRLDEVVGGVAAIQQRSGDRPLCLGGFSLGGNFSLRVAARADDAGIELAQVVAICPVLHPPSTLDALRNGFWVYNAYFMYKWRRSLKIKHRLFPEDVDIDAILAQGTMHGLTEHLITSYSEFKDLDTYLDGYSIVGDRLATVRAPTVMLLAEDDPVIPIAQLDDVNCPQSVRVVRTPHGGHCGFLQSLFGESWADTFMLEYFSNAVSSRADRPALRSNVA